MNQTTSETIQRNAPLTWDTAKKFEEGTYVVSVRRARHPKGYFLYSIVTGVVRPGSGEPKVNVPVYFDLESFEGGTPKLQHDFAEILGRLMIQARDYILQAKAQAMVLRKRAENNRPQPQVMRAGKTERDRNKHRK